MFLDVPVGLWTHSNEIKLLDLKIEVRGDRTDDPGEETTTQRRHWNTVDGAGAVLVTPKCPPLGRMLCRDLVQDLQHISVFTSAQTAIIPMDYTDGRPMEFLSGMEQMN